MKAKLALTTAIAALVGTLAIGCGPSTPDEFTKTTAKVYCKRQIKKLLRDPDSYQFISATVTSTSGQYDQYGKALVSFRSKNGFGGYVNGTAECEVYNNAGETWTKAKLL